MPETFEPGHEAHDPPPFRVVDILILAALCLLSLGLFVTFRQNAAIQQTQQDGIVRGYKNRAATCNLLAALGAKVPDECTDDAIRPYLDADVASGTTTAARETLVNREILCQIVAQQPNMVLPAACSEVGR